MVASNNKYVRFLLRLISIILIFLALDLLFGNILRFYYFKQESGLLYRTTYAIDSTKADILVFGSSRANHHYVPDIFEDSLNMSFYNTGRDGNFLLYNYAVFKAILKRYSPNIVIFDINQDELFYNVESYERLSSLLPYYKDHPEIREIIKMKSYFEKFKLISSIYPFNSSLLSIGIGNLELNKKRKSDKKGFVPLNGLIGDTVLRRIETTTQPMDSKKIKALRDIMKLCLERNIHLIIVHSPIFGRIVSVKNYELVEIIEKNNNFVYWDFSIDSNFLTSPEFFQDQYHLNEIGATYFSKVIVKLIIEENYDLR